MVWTRILKKAKEEWPKVRIKREPNAETYKEMKVEARKKESMPMKEQSSSFIATKQEQQQAKRLDLSRYSKWYRINDDNKVRIRSFVSTRTLLGLQVHQKSYKKHSMNVILMNLML